MITDREWAVFFAVVDKIVNDGGDSGSWWERRVIVDAKALEHDADDAWKELTEWYAEDGE